MKKNRLKRARTGSTTSSKERLRAKRSSLNRKSSNLSSKSSSRLSLMKILTRLLKKKRSLKERELRARLKSLKSE